MAGTQNEKGQSELFSSASKNHFVNLGCPPKLWMAEKHNGSASAHATSNCACAVLHPCAKIKGDIKQEQEDPQCWLLLRSKDADESTPSSFWPFFALSKSNAQANAQSTANR